MARRTPWWVHQQWVVKTRASRDASDGSFKRGDWIEIYLDRTKKQAQEDAQAWSERTGQPTTIEPGPGHKTRRVY